MFNVRETSFGSVFIYIYIYKSSNIRHLLSNTYRGIGSLIKLVPDKVWHETKGGRSHTSWDVLTNSYETRVYT